MAGHEKVYGVCENKCLVLVEPLANKLPIESHYEMGRFKETVDGVEVERKVMHYCSGKLNIDNFQQDYDHNYCAIDTTDLNIPIREINALLNCYVIVKYTNHPSYGNDVGFDNIPARLYHYDGRGGDVDELRFNGTFTVGSYVTIYIDYVINA